MPFQLSPGVAVVEKDFSSIVPAVSTSAGAFAGAFAWGPVLDPVQISSENQLAERYGIPNDSNFMSFFTAANFLSYTNNLLVTRTDAPNLKNAVATQTGSVVVTITGGSQGAGYETAPTITLSAPSDAGGVQATGTTVPLETLGTIKSIAVPAGGGGAGYTTAPTITLNNVGTGAGLSVTATVSGGAITAYTVSGTSNQQYPAGVTLTITPAGGDTITTPATYTIVRSCKLQTGAVTLTAAGTGYTTATATLTGGNPTTPAVPVVTVAIAGIKIKNGQTYQNSFSGGQGVTGPWAAKFPGTLGNAIRVSVADSASFETWAYKAEFDSAPGTSPAARAAGKNAALDEMHIIVIDATGAWTGTTNTVLEKFAYVSKAAGAKRVDGSNVYYKDVINTNSKYLWWTDHVAATGGNALGSSFVNMTQAAFSTLATAYTVQLSGGVDDYSFTDAQAQEGYALYKNDEVYDISLIPMGAAPAATVIWAMTNLVGFDSAGARKDAIVFCSPQDSLGGVITSQSSTAIADTIAYRNALPSTSFGVMDSGYKYQYDRYNDKYRFVPMNGDIAGLCARTDYTADPWYSPGGFARGQIKNVIKLAVTPDKTERDLLYKAGINPVVTFPGQGTVMFGDKTLLANPSAFDRINVRRLFIVLEKSIATAAKFQLFEFNDGFTRAQFRNLIEPFLRDVQGRRGIVDFRVKCDETNNTGEVIDRNEFAADIFVKPNRSINFITLTFVAARSSVNFDEIGG